MPRNLRNCLGPLYWRWSCSVRSTAALKKSREVVLEFWSFLWQGMMSSKNLKVFVKIWVCYQGDLDSTIITVHADMIHASLEHVLSCCLRKMFAAGETTSLYHSIPISHAFDVDVTYQVSVLLFPFRVSKTWPTDAPLEKKWCGRPCPRYNTLIGTIAFLTLSWSNTRNTNFIYIIWLYIDLVRYRNY